MSAATRQPSPVEVHAPWCDPRDRPVHGDQACWGPIERYVPLTVEEGYRNDAAPGQIMRFDPPRVGVFLYRREPGCVEVVRLHLYRPSENDFRSLDAELDLTVDEARKLIKNLCAAIEDIEQPRIAGAPW